jgi:hypothetical protein
VLQRLGVGFVQVSPHMPAAQVAAPVPADGVGHALPQAPQLLGSELSSTHAVLQRLGVGFVQVSPHAPAAQVAAPVPADGVGHSLPQAPQFAMSALKLVQSAVGPLSKQQSVAPVGQTPSPWAWSVGTAEAPTVIRCRFAGLSGGR